MLQAIFDGMIERIIAKPTTLFLIIHDEAHWSARKGDGKKIGVADAYINHPVLRNAPNVRVVSVSATPYNMQTCKSQVDPDNEINWSHYFDDTDGYYGIDQFVKAEPGFGSIQDDNDFEQHCRRSKAKDKQTRHETLLEEYIHAIACAAGAENPPGESSQYTKEMMADFIRLPLQRAGRGSMILLRTLRHNEAIPFAKGLREARARMGLVDRFAVILDIETNGAKRESTLGSHLAKEDPRLVERMQAVYPQSEKWKNVQLISKYEDLLDLPCCLIIVNKGKMGDRHVSHRLNHTCMHICSFIIFIPVCPPVCPSVCPLPCVQFPEVPSTLRPSPTVHQWIRSLPCATGAGSWEGVLLSKRN